MFKSVSFEVTGDKRLVCESCERRVERMLRALEGVGQVRARADNQHIDVLFDSAVLQPAAIAERLAKAGYEARVAAPASDSGS